MGKWQQVFFEMSINLRFANIGCTVTDKTIEQGAENRNCEVISTVLKNKEVI
jgi:hypothetical protein